MEADYVLTEDDALAAQDYYLRQQAKKTRNNYRIFLFLMVVGSVLVIYPLSSSLGRPLGARDYLAMAAAVMVIVGYFLWHNGLKRWFGLWWVRRNLDGPQLAAWRGRRRVRITPEEFTITEDDATLVLKWSRLVRINTSADYAFFFTSEQTALAVPVRAFTDLAVFDEFVDTARRYRKRAEDLPPEDHPDAPAYTAGAPEVEFALTADEVVPLTIRILERGPWWQVHPWQVYLLILLGSVGFATLDLVGGSETAAQTALIVLLGGGGLVAVWAAYRMMFWRIHVDLQVQKTLKEADDDTPNWCRFSLTPERLTITTADSRTVLNWSRVREIELTEERAFFWCSHTSAHVLPRRPFATAEEFKEFVEVARRYRAAAIQGQPATIPPETGITTQPRHG
jgi:hypothetical protein